MRIDRCATGLAAAIALLAACAGPDSQTDPATSFTATMVGSNEVPAVTTAASGSASLAISGTSLNYTVNVSSITAVTVSHIHVGAAGANGTVRVNLCGTGAPAPACTSGTGVLATGTATVISPGITFDSLVSALRSFGAYVNVHTTANGGGEIRGQIFGVY